VEALWRSAQDLTGGMLEMVFADQGDTGEQARDAAHNSKIELIVVKHPDASRGSCPAAETMDGGTFAGVVVAVSSIGA